MYCMPKPKDSISERVEILSILMNHFERTQI
jgi:hypothetical protein